MEVETKMILVFVAVYSFCVFCLEQPMDFEPAPHTHLQRNAQFARAVHAVGEQRHIDRNVVVCVCARRKSKNAADMQV